MEKKVYVKNVSSFNIELNLRQVRYVRDLEPGQRVSLAEDVYEEFSCDPGCKSLMKDGFLKVVSDDEEEIDVDKLLTEQSAQALAKVLMSATPALKQKIVDRAMFLSIADATRVSLIKHHCGVDVLHALALQR